MRRFFQMFYYKIRIIVSFCLVAIILVLIMSRVSYHFIKDLYLNQLEEQVNTVSNIIAVQIDDKYLGLLQVGKPTIGTEEYFKKIFRKNLSRSKSPQLFIFDNNFNIVVHSDSSQLPGRPEPRLYLNQKEILDLEVRHSTASLPFKGEDGKWYLWGFFRLDQNYWLALKESASRLEKVKEFSMIFWYIGLGGSLFAILLGWIIARSITQPIDKLVTFSGEIGKGKFNSSVPQGMHGEIGLLLEALDKMRHGLSEHQKEKENMLAQIAHEIRNPLGGIELLANLIKEDANSGDKSNDYINKILDEVNGLKSLITSYLNYSRPTPPNPEWINLSGLLSEIENICELNLSNKNAVMESDIDLEKIWFDRAQLRQILINLITNSIESISKEGKIQIVAGLNTNKYEIKVSDNGAGIAADKLQLIFEPFQTTKKEGTGLGLAISKKLCMENNAEINVNNNENGGCTFTITKEIDK